MEKEPLKGKEKSFSNNVYLVIEELDKKIQELFQSDDYMLYLKKLSLLHDYSYNNIILILMQNPNASMVASFTTFNKMHRRIIKGSKAIKILCPCTSKHKKKVSPTGENKNNDTSEVEENHIYFKLGNVFDISQTEAVDKDGEIKSFVKPLTFNSDFLTKLISNLKHSLKIPINYDLELTGSTNGYYLTNSKEIYLKKGMSNLQELKTLIHELAHYYQHEYYSHLIKEFSRNDLEVCAESTAYVVFCMLRDYYNLPEIDSSDYSIGYIASWSKDKTLKELKTTLTLISKISNDLFSVISPAILQS